MNQACYRKLRRYKYQLTQPYALATGIRGFTVGIPFIRLSPQGTLDIAARYAWDGPSGPTIDTPDFMRGSLVHDALYQLIRKQAIPYRYRSYADLLLKKICLEDGMPPFRATYVHWFVTLFGGRWAKPGRERPDEIVCVPP